MSESHHRTAELGSRICKKYFGTKLQKCKMSLCFSVFLCFFSILLFNQLYFDKGTFYYETSNFYIFLVLLMGLCSVIEFFIRYRKIRRDGESITFSVLSFSLIWSMYLLEFTDISVGSALRIQIPFLLLNYLLCFIIIFLIMNFSNGNKVVIISFWLLTIAFCLLQYYSVKYRNWIVTFKDVTGAKSALSIADDFSFIPNCPMLLALLVSLLFVVMVIFVKIEKLSIKKRVVNTGLCVLLSALFAIGTNIAYNASDNDFLLGAGWDKAPYASVTSKKGLLVTIYCDAVYNRLQSPIDYDEEVVSKELSYSETFAADDDILIIGILSESLSDYRNYAQVDCPDYLSYWRSLDENVIKGYVTVSPYGGMTCNSEYEFLTGNSSYFLPKESAVFTNYLNSPQSSLVRYLKDSGFYTVSYNPFNPNVWNATNAYNNLGFDECVDIRDMHFEEEDADASGKHMTDLALYKNLVSYIEANDKGKPSFYWLTTAQNHQPYNYKNDKHFSVKGSPELETYLNGVYDSDEAMKWLFEYYQNSDKKVYIFVFGDHYPALNRGSCKLLYKGFESKVACHQTPYVIWSNQDIGYEWNDNVSLNYLSCDLFRVANIPLSTYQTYLEEFRKEYPIVSAIGYKNKEGVWQEYTINVNPKEDSTLNKYHSLQWYKMFDEKIEE